MATIHSPKTSSPLKSLLSTNVVGSPKTFARESPPQRLKKTCSCGDMGCVLYPGLPCPGTEFCKDKQKCKKSIATKIFFKDALYKKETDIYDTDEQILKRLDPSEQYFLSSYTKCPNIQEQNIESYNCDYEDSEESKENIDTTTRTVADGEGLDWLSAIRAEEKAKKTKPPKNFKAINFSYLGNDMHKEILNLKFENIKDFLISLKNVFAGLKILNEAGIYHNDIKPKNIVLDKTDNNFKLIDFGQAFFEPKESKLGNEPLKQEEFTGGFVSPELYYHIVNTQLKKVEKGIQTDFGFTAFGNSQLILTNSEDLKNKASESDTTTNFNYLELIKKNNIVLFNLKLTYYDNSESHDIIYPEQKSIDYYKDLDKHPELTYQKNDMWALGCVLKWIINKIINLLLLFNRTRITTQKTLSESPNKVDYAMLVREFNEVIKKLLVLDVEKRANPEEALEFYQLFLDKIYPTSNSGGRKTRKYVIRRRRTFRKHKTGKRKRSSSTKRRNKKN